MKRLTDFLVLFTSTSTLICCALPALLISLGMGAALAGLVSNVPALIWVSQHKVLVFSVAAIGLILGGVMQYRARFEPCPTDPRLAAACTKTRKRSKAVYVASVGIYVVGAFFAFIAPLLSA